MRVSLTMVALGLGLGLTAQQNIAINATGRRSGQFRHPRHQCGGTFRDRKEGVLMPRMTLAQRGALTTLAGLTIHQTDNTPGFYYYNGLAWVRLTNGSPGWGILGNDLVDHADDWIGTTDGAALTFRRTMWSTSALMAQQGAWVWGISPQPSVWM
ncbi:MAG: hypothetical protein IPH53_18615 [Flavobacteriales bacterium]|nr:hypothetical protein [Flavobacteriales bacterium]